MAEEQMTLTEAIALMYEVRLGDRHSDALAKVLRAAEAVSEAPSTTVAGVYVTATGFTLYGEKDLVTAPSEMPSVRRLASELLAERVRIVREDVL